jgi:hypothetical protein
LDDIIKSFARQPIGWIEANGLPYTALRSIQVAQAKEHKREVAKCLGVPRVEFRGGFELGTRGD